jgi:hypothetical protein
VGSTSAGINFECRSGVISDNIIKNCLSHGITIHNESDFDGDIVCNGNRVDTVGGSGIYLFQGARGTSAVYNSATIQGNTIQRCDLIGIRATTPTAQFTRALSITGNSINITGGRGMWIEGARVGSLTGNVINAPGEYGIRIDDSVGLAVTGNNIALPNGHTFEGIYVVGSSAGSCTNINVTGNTIGAVVGSTTANAILFTTNVQYSLASSNITRQTGGVAIGAGTGNVAANNI